jgi:peptidoglycan/LPS O-acetylase OafA/YrhL
MRTLARRGMALLLLVLGLSLLWNALDSLRYVDSAPGYGVMALQVLAAPAALLAGHWLWRSDRRGLKPAALALVLGAASGTLAAWTYAPHEERVRAALGAAAGGLALAAVVLVLSRAGLATKPIAEVARAD